MQRFLIFCVLFFNSYWAFAQVHVFTFTPVPQFEQRKLLKIWAPLLKKLEEHTGYQFKFESVENIEVFSKGVEEGAYDFAYGNPYHALVAIKTQNYEPLIRSDAEKLKGILVVKKDGDIKKIEDLQGKKIAFPSPNALAASMLMRAELIEEHQLDFESVYVKTHPSTYLHVAKGLTEAGGGVQRTFDDQPEEYKGHLKIIYETREVFPHPIFGHPRVGVNKLKKIQEALLKIAQEEPQLFEDISMQQPVKASKDEYMSLDKLNLNKYYQQ